MNDTRAVISNEEREDACVWLLISMICHGIWRIMSIEWDLKSDEKLTIHLSTQPVTQRAIVLPSHVYPSAVSHVPIFYHLYEVAGWLVLLTLLYFGGLYLLSYP